MEKVKQIIQMCWIFRQLSSMYSLIAIYNCIHVELVKVLAEFALPPCKS